MFGARLRKANEVALRRLRIRLSWWMRSGGYCFNIHRVGPLDTQPGRYRKFNLANFHRSKHHTCCGADDAYKLKGWRSNRYKFLRDALVDAEAQEPFEGCSPGTS